MFESSLYDCAPCIELVGGLVSVYFTLMLCLFTLPPPPPAKWTATVIEPGNSLSKVCHSHIKVSIGMT